MPYPAQGLYPSSLLYPLEAGVEFVNFTKDFKRLVERYGRSLKNDRTNLSFRAILNILSGTKCIGDNRTMNCGDAVAYVVPSLSYEIGDHITPVSGRGEWVIVTERYASRIGDLRIFRALGLERYTPGTTLTGIYTVVEPAIVGVDMIGVYALTEALISLEMLSRYDINALETPGIVFSSKYDLRQELISSKLIGRYDLTEELISLAMLSRYDINALDVPGMILESKYDIIALDAVYPSTTLYPSTSLYPRGLGRAADIMNTEFGGLYDITKTPAQVAGERAVATGDMIDIYWRPWDDEDLSYYKVHRSLNTGFTPSDANLVGVPNTNAFKHINLAALTQYYFKVCAVTKLGVSGAYSAQFTATTT